MVSLAQINDSHDIEGANHSGFSGPLSRRQLLGRGGKAGAALLALALVGKTALDAEPAGAAGFYSTGAALNLRTGPGTNYGIILVVPKGAVVTDLGAFQNNYRKVSYQGSAGWVIMDYLIVSDGSGNESPDFVSGMRVVSAANFRSGPSTSNSVFRVLPAGTVVQASLQTTSGFRYVSHNGQAGWIFDDLLAAIPDGENPGSLATTDYVNLRAQPSLSAKVLIVLPPHQLVTPTGKSQNGFEQVTLSTPSGPITGWVHGNYLRAA
jgi:uncharacterized protein YraI